MSLSERIQERRQGNERVVPLVERRQQGKDLTGQVAA